MGYKEDPIYPTTHSTTLLDIAAHTGARFSHPDCQDPDRTINYSNTRTSYVPSENGPLRRSVKLCG